MGGLEQRSEKRHKICHAIRMHIIDSCSDDSGSPPAYDGFIDNLSSGGMCICLIDEEPPLKVGDVLGKRIKVDVTTPNANHPISFSGDVSWGTREGQPEHVVMLGLRFIEMTDLHFENVVQLLTFDTENHCVNHREKRYEMSHPVKIHIVNPEGIRSGLPAKYNGFVKDMSKGGMCIYLDDGNNPLNTDNLLGERLKMEMVIPSTNEQFFLLGEVLWGTHEEETNLVRIGLEFVEMMDLHLKNIEQLLTVYAKDHNMLWNLWDNLEVNQ